VTHLLCVSILLQIVLIFQFFCYYYHWWLKFMGSIWNSIWMRQMKKQRCLENFL